MSDIFENNQDNNLEQPLADDNVSEQDAPEVQDEESTVFSAPLEHKDHKSSKSNLKKKIISIASACLAVVILIVGTLLIKNNFEEIKQGEAPDDAFEDITILDRDSSTFTAVDITNDNGNFKFETKQIVATNDDGESQSENYWTVDNLDITKLSSSTVNDIITNAASITASFEIDTKTKEQCGFNEPIIKVSVTDSKNGNFAFSVGDESPDGLGYYFSFDDSDKIYVVPTSELASFHFELIDLTDKTAIPITLYDTDTSANKLADGSYGYFDSITLSGSLFPDTITFINNPDKNSTAEIVPYLITTPKNLTAQKENVATLLTLFSKTINVAGNYSVDVSDESLKEFGLDEPDAVVTMTINGEGKTFKFSKVDDEFCAVVYDGAIMIRKVTLESFAFLSLKPEDFFYSQPFMCSMNDVSSIEFVENENRIKIDLSYTEDADEVKTFSAKVNGKEIPIGDFQNFHEMFVDIRCSGYDVTDPTADAVSSLTISFHEGEAKTIDFYSASAIEYQFSINDEHIGKITSSSYQKMVRNFKELLEITTK